MKTNNCFSVFLRVFNTGKYYKSNLNTITLVPKANLEMNKEGLAAGLVCMLEERLLPRHKAKFEEQVERFFIAGAARIDLIAKVIDLDNAIGGYNFDIPNLEETANEIELLKTIKGKDKCFLK